MKMMNYMMVIMIVYFGLVMPTAMSFYWITTNVITVIRTIFIQIKFIENAKEEKEKKDANVIRQVINMKTFEAKTLEDAKRVACEALGITYEE